MSFGGQQRLDKIGQRSKQLAADLNAHQLKSIAAGRVMAALGDRIIAALNVKFDKQSAALDKSVELLAVLTRVAEEALQPHGRWAMWPWCDRWIIIRARQRERVRSR